MGLSTMPFLLRTDILTSAGIASVFILERYVRFYNGDYVYFFIA
jgi:hypothetical protein